MDGKYSVESFREAGEGAGIERVLVRHDHLQTARALYKAHVSDNPGRLVTLCDSGTGVGQGAIRPDTTPQ
jgi:hypothetical protein